MAIVGTSGVPARYGGFETLVEQLARHIDHSKVTLTIYGQKSAYLAAERVGDFCGHRRVWIPFSARGGQSLLHDALQLLHATLIARVRVVLLLGTSAAWVLPFVRLLRPGLVLIAHIDGLEWRRDKFGRFTKGLLKWLEARAIRSSDHVIADNEALLPLVRDIHGVESVMIAYGGDHIEIPNQGVLQPNHALAIARIEPENNTAMILGGVEGSGVPLVFVGNWSASQYGRNLHSKYSGKPGHTLHDPIYDQGDLAPLRAGSICYIHGHSVGGTNPSLVEAIFHSDRIIAFDCPFNRATLDNEGAYFRDAEELRTKLRDPAAGIIEESALRRLRERYRWESISAQYLSLFEPI